MMVKLKFRFTLFWLLKQILKIFPIILLLNFLYNYISFTFMPKSNITSIEKHFGGKTAPNNVSHPLLINTSGCAIRNYAETFRFVETGSDLSCPDRAIFIEKTSENEILFLIDNSKFNVYKYFERKHEYDCCYKFASRSTELGSEDTRVKYTFCKDFKTGTKAKLKDEVVTVACNSEDADEPFYEDAYMFVKKRKVENDDKPKNEQKKLNVLIVGMDSMSRARVYNTMPATSFYFNTHGWLDYRGFHKIGYNTYPNLMALMTGNDPHNVFNESIKDQMLWNNFKDEGYMTAYGEDYLCVPDTFQPYGGFKAPPTDHYMRPLFVAGEKFIFNIVCTQKLSSARHVLSYAQDFAHTYKNDSFFGLFWINSYSHKRYQTPSQIDVHIRNFFIELDNAGILNNTLVLFLSDHGIRFNEMRYHVEGYYDERLPMLFVWVPKSFRDSHKIEYNNAVINQHRLVTPFDLHATLLSVLSSNNSFEESDLSNPHSISIWQEHPEQRTCENASISVKWCACHELIETNKTIYEAQKSILLMMTFIRQYMSPKDTQDCRVLRIHTFTKSGVKFYVIAIGILEKVYEGMVSEDSTDHREVVGDVYEISEKSDKLVAIDCFYFGPDAP